MEKQLEGRDYLIGDHTIADIACWGWSRNWKRQGQNTRISALKAWHERCASRSAVARVQAGPPICAIPIIRSAKTPSLRRFYSVSARAPKFPNAR
jgi:hypothetical protein